MRQLYLVWFVWFVWFRGLTCVLAGKTQKIVWGRHVVRVLGPFSFGPSGNYMGKYGVLPLRLALLAQGQDGDGILKGKATSGGADGRLAVFRFIR